MKDILIGLSFKVQRAFETGRGDVAAGDATVAFASPTDGGNGVQRRRQTGTGNVAPVHGHSNGRISIFGQPKVLCPGGDILKLARRFNAGI
jgi:hypothetical protein